jgi:hypothetical protein
VSRSKLNHVIWSLENRQMLTASGLVASRNGLAVRRQWSIGVTFLAPRYGDNK